MDFGPFILPTGALLAVVCVGFAWRAQRRWRLVQDLPTSKTTGVFIGLVELKGTAEAQQPLTSYLAEQPCVFYQWSIEEHWSRTVTETYTDDKGRPQTRTRTESGWTTVGQGGEQIPFYLQDDCGCVLVRPDDAQIEPLAVFDETCGPGDPLYYGKGPAGAVAHSDLRRRFTEKAIPLHSPLYVVGQARERQDIVAPEIAADPQAKMFLISTRTEKAVAAGLHGQFWGLGLLGLVLTVGGAMLGDNSMQREPSPALYVGVGAAYLALWFAGWLVTAYNCLVELRQRVRQGWANVDVQLHRRADLIPNLVRIVEGYRQHEQSTQTAVAALRTQLAATPPGQPGPDPAGCATMLMGLVERYPELAANTAFLDLQRQLVDTEQRIALARGYFNDIATFYNTRLQIIPDRFIAALGGMQPQALLQATDFERAPVTVEFAQ
jgi:hypothetical protein